MIAHPLYVLSPRAAQQVEELLLNIAEYSGEERSDRIERLLYASFAAIVAQPGIGHLRPDLVSAPVYFRYAKPYQTCTGKISRSRSSQSFTVLAT